MEENKQRTKCEVFSRVCGYCTRTNAWNLGKKEEFKDRKMFKTGDMK